MSAVAVNPDGANHAVVNQTGLNPGSFDLSGTPGIPLLPVVSVELRKLVDTRAGRWLLIAIGVITAAVIVVVYLTAAKESRTFVTFAQATAAPQGFLLPVLGILLMTSEWTQRTALVSFTLVPGRGRVLLAKTIAAVIAGLLALVVAIAIAALATLVSGAPQAWKGFGAAELGKLALLQEIGVLQGLAFGLLFLNSAAAIVTYFILPNAFTIVAALWKALADARPWIDLNASQSALFDGSAMGGRQWLQLGSGVAIWVLLPYAAGFWRVLRSEVK
jgi:ABC-2 type transport system permease protein